MSAKESFVAKKYITLNPEEEYITLQSLLKMNDIVSTGGMVKVFLMDNVVLVNGEAENRRGRKLYPGDEVCVLNKVFVIKKP